MTLRYPDIASYQVGIDLSGAPAVCAKVTQDTTYANPRYAAFKAEAAAHGAFFFSYHFLTQGNGAAQADHCYSKAGPAPLMLDFEPIKDNLGNYISKPSVADATAFIDRYRAVAEPATSSTCLAGIGPRSARHHSSHSSIGAWSSSHPTTPPPTPTPTPAPDGWPTVA